MKRCLSNLQSAAVLLPASLSQTENLPKIQHGPSVHAGIIYVSYLRCTVNLQVLL